VSPATSNTLATLGLIAFLAALAAASYHLGHSHVPRYEIVSIPQGLARLDRTTGEVIVIRADGTELGHLSGGSRWPHQGR
jgi:hypothetical protein